MLIALNAITLRQDAARLDFIWVVLSCETECHLVLGIESLIHYSTRNHQLAFSILAVEYVHDDCTFSSYTLTYHLLNSWHVGRTRVRAWGYNAAD